FGRLSSGSRHLVEIRSHGCMALPAYAARQRLVCDIANESVFERELLVPLDSRYRLAPDEIALLERSEQLRDVVTCLDSENGAAPEDAPDDGRVDEDAALGRRKRVEARGDNGTDAGRKRLCVRRLLGERGHQLLDEARIALCGLR